MRLHDTISTGRSAHAVFTIKNHLGWKIAVYEKALQRKEKSSGLAMSLVLVKAVFLEIDYRYEFSLEYMDTHLGTCLNVRKSLYEKTH